MSGTDPTLLEPAGQVTRSTGRDDRRRGARWSRRIAHRPILGSLLTPRQKIEFAILGLIWLVGAMYFWLWWLQPSHNIGTGRYLVSTAILAWTSFGPLYFLTIFSKAVVPVASTPVPRGLRVAMVVTKVPSEPFALVRETLEAMLRQTYPHDTWLADEDPAPETVAWCAANGVRISTRKGREDYHRKIWPRRTRCKEGNLAFFYDHYGYDNYDFVSQLDADHVPAPNYLEEMLRPFTDPRIGYVSAPSLCDRNAATSWSARGRLYEEGTMHGPLQAGYSNGLAPLCIGSHYAVRTVALKRIGGLGPELAEDHSTTLFMNAHGWRGAHALNAIAHGEGPATFPDMVTQEFQWSRSLIMLLLQYTPKLLSSLPPRLKFQFLFCQFLYPLLAGVMLAGFLVPVLALLLDVNMAGVTYVGFLLHAAVPQIAITWIVIRIARYGWCRPVNTKVVSWEGMLYVLARWPWWLLGTYAAMRDWMTGTFVDFRVTPKTGDAVKPLPFRVLVPYLLLSLGSGLPVLLLGNITTASGFYLLALVNCILYAALTITIIVKHAQGNRQSLPAWPAGLDPGRAVRAAIVAVLILVPTVALPLRAPQGLKAMLQGADQAIAQIVPEPLRRLAFTHPAFADTEHR